MTFYVVYPGVPTVTERVNTSDFILVPGLKPQEYIFQVYNIVIVYIF